MACIMMLMLYNIHRYCVRKLRVRVIYISTAAAALKANNITTLYVLHSASTCEASLIMLYIQCYIFVRLYVPSIVVYVSVRTFTKSAFNISNQYMDLKVYIHYTYILRTKHIEIVKVTACLCFKTCALWQIINIDFCNCLCCEAFAIA